MKHFLLISLTLMITSTGFSQSLKKETVLTSLTKVADNVVKNTTYLYYDKETGKQIQNLTQYGYNKNIVPQSDYNDWKYWNGVIHIGFNQLGKVTEIDRFKNYAKKNFEFFFKDYLYLKSIYNGKDQWHFPVAQGINITQLDDCGAMGASLIELYETEPKTYYREYIDMAADYIMNKQQRLVDGTFSRPVPHNKTVWADDLYMSVPFLVRMTKITGKKKYMEEAIKQVIQFNKHLYDDKVGLMWHCFYDDINVNGGTYWGRCNGWMMVATVDLLRYIPDNHPKKEKILELLRRQVRNIAQYQSSAGLWHQILNKEDSYLETSCTAMFTYAVAISVNHGWIPKRYSTIAIAGWKGIESQITTEGAVTNICMGTGIGNDIKFYYDRPVPYNDIHGLGAIFLAGIEVLKLLE